MKNAIYVVTGAAGHLGSYIVHALLQRGERVRALLLAGENMPDFIESRDMLSLYTGDVRNRDSLKLLFESGESADFIVIHCAGIISIAKKKHPLIYDVNVGGTRNIIEACRAHGVKKLIYISSVHAIPILPKGQIMREIPFFSPENVHGQYAKTKAEATQLVLDAAKDGLNATVLHPAGIIGPNASDVGNISCMLKDFVSGRFRVGVQGAFDFVDVRDVANGVLLAIQNGKSQECYILSNRLIDLREFFSILSEEARIKPLRLYLPLFFAMAAAPFAELYYRLVRKTPVFTRYSLMTLSDNALFSNEKARHELGYKTRDFRSTMRDIAAWLTVSQKH